MLRKIHTTIGFSFYFRAVIWNNLPQVLYGTKILLHLNLLLKVCVVDFLCLHANVTVFVALFMLLHVCLLGAVLELTQSPFKSLNH